MRGRPSCHRLDLTVFWKSRQKKFINGRYLIQEGRQRLAGFQGGVPRENPRSLSSPKAEKIELEIFLTCWGCYGTDGQSELYYRLGRG